MIQKFNMKITVPFEKKKNNNINIDAIQLSNA